MISLFFYHSINNQSRINTKRYVTCTISDVVSPTSYKQFEEESDESEELNAIMSETDKEDEEFFW